MKREDIIRMAHEADPWGPDGRLYAMAELTPEVLERFAALVAAAEREACAELCEEEGDGHRDGFGGHCAAMIRARSTP